MLKFLIIWFVLSCLGGLVAGRFFRAIGQAYDSVINDSLESEIEKDVE